MSVNNILCNGKAVSTSSDKPSMAKGGQNNETIQLINLNWLIHLSYARGEFKYCKEVIEHQLQSTYDHEFLYLMKGLIARAEGDLQESLRFLQKSIEFDPTNSETLKEIGKTLYSMQRWRQALEVFIKIDKRSQRPDHEVCFYIGELLYRYFSKTRPAAIDESKEYFHRAIRQGKQIEGFSALGEIYRMENNLTKSIEMLESTMQLTTENVETMTEIGILYLRIGDTKNAFDKLFDVTKSEPNNSKALLALGSILQSKTDIDGALNKYKYIDDEAQKGAEVWNNVGLCFFRKKKFIASISCLKKAIWIDPTNFNCLYNLGLVYLTAQQYASAFHCLAAAVCIRTDFAECYMLLGICLKNLNDHGNAYLAFERSAMLPDAIKNPLIYLNFAIYCWRTKRFEQAAANLDNFFNVAKSIPMRPEFMNAAIKLKQFLPPAIQAEQEDPPTTPIPTELSPKTTILSANPVEEGSGETMDDSQTSRDMLI